MANSVNNSVPQQQIPTQPQSAYQPPQPYHPYQRPPPSNTQQYQQNVSIFDYILSCIKSNIYLILGLESQP